MKTRTENWRGYNIRFVEIDGNWWAVLKDICDALNLSTWKVAQRLEPNMLEKMSIEADLPSSPVTSKNGVRKSQTMLVVNDQLMCSVTVQGGDVDVRPFDEVYKEQE